MSSTETRPIPSPMTEERLKLMQARAAKGETLTGPADQPAVTKSIGERGKKTSKHGFTVLARSVGNRNKNNRTREARFDDDGEAIEEWHPFAALDRYLEIALKCRGALNREGRAALDQVMRERV